MFVLTIQELMNCVHIQNNGWFGIWNSQIASISFLTFLTWKELTCLLNKRPQKKIKEKSTLECGSWVVLHHLQKYTIVRKLTKAGLDVCTLLNGVKLKQPN